MTLILSGLFIKVDFEETHLFTVHGDDVKLSVLLDQLLEPN